jgi:hypothetical protein
MSLSDRLSGVLTFPLTVRTVGPDGAGEGVAVGAAVGAAVGVGEVQPLIARAVTSTINITNIAGAFMDFMTTYLHCYTLAKSNIVSYC